MKAVAKKTQEKKRAAQEGTRGSALAARLARLGIKNDANLILHLPLRYEDYTELTPLAQLRAGMSACCEGVVVHSEIQYRPRRQWVCAIEDGAMVLTLRFFTFYPNQQKALAIGARVRVFGETRDGYYGLEMVHPKAIVVHADTMLPDGLLPVYPTTVGLSQEMLTNRIRRALDNTALLNDLLPSALREREQFWTWERAIRFLHKPPRLTRQERAALDERVHPAWQRVKFDELLAQQLSLKRHRKQRKVRRACALSGDGALTSALIKILPFSLTGAQQKVWHEIENDMAQEMPMHRLLQGDVGSGKTVIAALAALRAIECGKQVALMAPTEILAEQHYRKLSAWFADLSVELVWLSGGLPAAKYRKSLATMAEGKSLLAIGTHALFQQDVALPNLALAIVDEQHRFGVAQRLALRDKGQKRQKSNDETHQLMMSATPIPRTLAMSFYADLDVSIIDQLPPRRVPVATRLVDQRRRAEIVAHVGKRCANGAQAYWVCPLVEESEKLDLLAAQTLYEELREVFNGNHQENGVALPRLEVGLLHGKMKSAKKTEVMEAFVRGEIHLLVATTVIEVGMDVPNAATMIIEHAERFGLAQLHQLRGRVGRGAQESQCVLLFETPLGALAKARLKVIYENHDGFDIAREDLRIRGPGELLGARQSGVPLLRFADPERDEKLLERAGEVANQILAMADGETIALAFINRWLGDKAEFFKA
ncbi:MAG: ATP-dependent DNA helicase RecG [Burkholderiales bacterium]|jgi:ATP-dependent DNA helicase RecG|nr:ATP-dependent DNA helicase RecG [Burkholderiales bacterium]